MSYYEDARVRAYRAARIYEPSMEGYTAAMAVYVAAFGEHPGEVKAVAADPRRGEQGQEEAEVLRRAHPSGDTTVAETEPRLNNMCERWSRTRENCPELKSVVQASVKSSERYEAAEAVLQLAMEVLVDWHRGESPKGTEQCPECGRFPYEGHNALDYWFDKVGNLIGKEPQQCTCGLAALLASETGAAAPSALKEKCFRNCSETTDPRVCAAESGLSINWCCCDCHDLRHQPETRQDALAALVAAVKRLPMMWPEDLAQAIEQAERALQEQEGRKA